MKTRFIGGARAAAIFLLLALSFAAAAPAQPVPAASALPSDFDAYVQRVM